MATNKKISELQENTAISLADFLPIVSPGSTLTQKVNVARILALGGASGGSGGGGAMLDAFTINLPGDPLKANGHTVNIGDSVSSLLKLILSPAIAAVISAGSNQTVALSSNLNISLTATETPGSNPITTRQWSIISGPASLTINNAGQQHATLTGFTPNSAGTYQLKYHTVDTEGTVVDSLVTELVVYNPPAISVSPVNLQLTGTQYGLAGEMPDFVTITPQSYPVASYLYTLLSAPAGANQAVVAGLGAFEYFTVAGTYQVNLTVTDVNGHTASVNIPVNVAPQPFSAVVDYAFLDHDAFYELQQADNINYTGHYSIPANNATWLMPWSDAPDNHFPVMRVLSSANQTLKNKWTDTSGTSSFNVDTFGDDSGTARKFTAGLYDYYTWFAPVSFDHVTAGSTVNISIS